MRRTRKTGASPPGTAPNPPDAPQGVRPRRAERENLVPDDPAEQLEAAAQRLRREGEELAERLEGLAADVRSGVERRDARLSAAVDAWLERRAATARLALGSAGGTSWAEPQTYDDLDRILAQVRAETFREEIEAAEADRASLVTMLRGTSNAAVLVGLQAAFDALDARLQELRSAAGLPREPRPLDLSDPRAPAELAPVGGLPVEQPLPEAVTDTAHAAQPRRTCGSPTSRTYRSPSPRTCRRRSPRTSPPHAPRAPLFPWRPARRSPRRSPLRRPVRSNPCGALFDEGTAAAPAVPTPPRHGSRPGGVPLAEGLGEPIPAPRQPVGAPSAGAPQQTPDGAEPTTAEPSPVTAECADVWTRVGDSPSPVEKLIAGGGLAEAYWLNRAAGEREERCRCLAFAASAFGLAPGQQAAMTLQLDVEEERGPLPTAEDRDGYLVAFAAAVRSGLQAGWALPIVNDFVQLHGLPEVWNELFTTLARETRRGVSFQPGEVLRLGQDDTVDPTDLGARAEALKLRLQTSKIAYQLASRVLQTLLKDDAELGRTLDLITAWSVGAASLEQLREDLGGTYGGDGAVDRIIKETTRRVSSPNQRKAKIIATALDQLRGRIGEVTTLLREAVQVAELPPRGDSRRLASELVDAVRAARQAAPLPGPGGEAVRLLLGWISTGGRPGRTSAPSRAAQHRLPASHTQPDLDHHARRRGRTGPCGTRRPGRAAGTPGEHRSRRSGEGVLRASRPG